MVNGGYYIKARKIQNSEISNKPPHVREIWDWLIKEANHVDSDSIKRGQTMRSLRDIQEGLKWYAGYRKEVYSKSKCEMAMKWLRNAGMITTTKTTRGMVITVCNYDFYQTPKNYETNNEIVTKQTMNQQPCSTINKNDNNNNNKELNIPFDSSLEKPEKKKSSLDTPEGKIPFDDVWNLYDKNKGKDDALVRNWNKTSKANQLLIMEYIPKYKNAQPNKKYRKDFSSFLNKKAWNDEIIDYNKPTNNNNYGNTKQQTDQSNFNERISDPSRPKKYRSTL